jgi:hypothetical protein
MNSVNQRNQVKFMEEAIKLLTPNAIASSYYNTGTLPMHHSEADFQLQRQSLFRQHANMPLEDEIGEATNLMGAHAIPSYCNQNLLLMIQLAKQQVMDKFQLE